MSCVQSISSPNRGLLIGPNVRNARNFCSLSRASYLNATCLYPSPSIKFCQHKVYPRLVHNARKSERCTPVYAFGKKGNSTSENEPFSWESLKKAIGGFRRELTVQDMLKEQAQERQFDGNGGGGISRGGGGSGGSSGPEDEGSAGRFGEFLQVLMAFGALVFLYVQAIGNEELILIARDYIKYRFGAKPSVRLTNAMKKWRDFCEKMTWREVEREGWLEEAVFATPTWWYDPDDHRQQAYLESTDYDSDDLQITYYDSDDPDDLQITYYDSDDPMQQDDLEGTYYDSDYTTQQQADLGRTDYDSDDPMQEVDPDEPEDPPQRADVERAIEDLKARLKWTDGTYYDPKDPLQQADVERTISDLKAFLETTDGTYYDPEDPSQRADVGRTISDHKARLERTDDESNKKQGR